MKIPHPAYALSQQKQQSDYEKSVKKSVLKRGGQSPHLPAAGRASEAQRFEGSAERSMLFSFLNRRMRFCWERAEALPVALY